MFCLASSSVHVICEWGCSSYSLSSEITWNIATICNNTILDSLPNICVVQSETGASDGHAVILVSTKLTG